MPCKCEILTPEQAMYDGTMILATSGSATVTRNGYLAQLVTGQLQVCASGSKPVGMFYDHLDLHYQVTIAAGTVDCIDINAFNSGMYTNVAMGNFQVLLDADMFVGGALPAVGATVYEGAGGLWTATPGTYACGKVLSRTVGIPHRTGAYNVAKIQVELDHL